jgi:parvulin-like peptidyl-prolyl isomerase
MEYSNGSFKRLILFSLAITTCIVFLHPVALHADSIDGIVAVVDKQLVMRSDLNRRLLLIGISPNNETRSRQILELMIEEIVIQKTYEKYGLVPINPKQSAEVAEANKISEETARIMIMRKSLMDTMVSSRVVVTPQMIKDEFKNNPEYSGKPSLDLKQIAVKEDKEKADRAAAEIKAGKPFDEVAREYSDILTDGKCNLGWMPLDALDSVAAKALEKLKIGDVSEPLKINDYWCIFMVTGRDVVGARNFEEAKDQISTSLLEKAREDAFDHWLKQIMGEYFIGIYM